MRAILTASAVLGLAAWLFARGAAPREPDAVAAGGPAHGPASGAGFEATDVRTRPVAIAMVVSALAIALSIAGLIVTLRGMHARDAAAPPLTAQQTAIIVPPGPPLQSDPVADLAALRRREAIALATYRWRGPDHAAAQIPIARAMALVVGRSLDPEPGAAP